MMETKLKMLDGVQFWQRAASLPSIPTFSHKLDNILGSDGVPLGSLIEILGLPGTGKTQLCLQLCASVQIPEALGGLNAEALYIDTNTNFVLNRFQEILSACSTKCQKLLCKANNKNEEQSLKQLHYVNAFGLEKFCAFMHQLPKFIAEHNSVESQKKKDLKEDLKILKKSGTLRAPVRLEIGRFFFCAMAMQQSSLLHEFAVARLVWGSTTISQTTSIRLIVIDSIAFPFKEGITAKQRTGLLFRQMAELQRLAVQNRIAVVLTNEMSTRLGLSTGAVVGSFGDAWAHRCNVRLLLSAPDDPNGDRLALILKSNIAPEAVAPFQITEEGIRDVD